LGPAPGEGRRGRHHAYVHAVQRAWRRDP